MAAGIIVCGGYEEYFVVYFASSVFDWVLFMIELTF